MKLWTFEFGLVEKLSLCRCSCVGLCSMLGRTKSYTISIVGEGRCRRNIHTYTEHTHHTHSHKITHLEKIYDFNFIVVQFPFLVFFACVRVPMLMGIYTSARSAIAIRLNDLFRVWHRTRAGSSRRKKVHHCRACISRELLTHTHRHTLQYESNCRVCRPEWMRHTKKKKKNAKQRSVSGKAFLYTYFSSFCRNFFHFRGLLWANIYEMRMWRVPKKIHK